MDKKAYCDNCCANVEFNTISEIINVKSDGLKFSYNAIVPRCTTCNSELSIPEINDLNIIRAYTAEKEALERKS